MKIYDVMISVGLNNVLVGGIKETYSASISTCMIDIVASLTISILIGVSIEIISGSRFASLNNKVVVITPSKEFLLTKTTIFITCLN